MKQHWEKFSAKIDGLSLRERVLIFAAAAFLLVSLVNALFLDPLLAKQKSLSEQVVQQQEKMKEIQAQIEALLQAQKDDANSPLRQRLRQAEDQLEEGDAWLQASRERMVQPEKMAGLLEQVLQGNGKLQLVSLQTLPVAPLIEKTDKPGSGGANAAALDQQAYKHGVQIAVRGSYPDLLQYVTALEHLPAQMFWGKAEMKVEKHPDVVLTLTLYTLSLDKTWLQI